MMAFGSTTTSGGQHQKQKQQQQPLNNSYASSTMIVSSMHMDYIHKVAFDTYGRRMATCSGDRHVCLWDLQDSGEWILSVQWPAHRGAVTSIAWAHPEFGSLLATCGTDHDAKIWEEQQTTAAGGAAQQSSSSSSRWMTRASLTEARRAVTCLEFAPRHWGLKLAVGSADGCVRIYEAVDVMNLTQWPMAQELESFVVSSSSSTSSGGGGGGGTTGGGMSNSGGGMFQQQSQQQQHRHQHYHKLGCTSLSWCTGRFEPPTLVAGGNNNLIIYRYSEQARSWQSVMQLPSSSSTGAVGAYDVLDVAWAPNVGRRFHYIASAEDQHLRIYKLARKAKENNQPTDPNSSKSSNKPKQQQLLTLESSQVIPTNAWRCQWNVTGTVLASSGDGGMVQLWKPNADGDFQCVSHIQGDLSSQVNEAANTGSNAMTT